MMWALIVLPFATLLLAWLASQITPAFVSRYFAPALAAILLLAAWGAARAGIVGLVAIALSVVFTVHVSSYTPQYKSNMRDVAGEMGPLLHPGDLVIVGQPEQVPLAWYYLPTKPAVREHARQGLGPHVHELGVRAKAAQPRQAAGDARSRCLLASGPASRCCSSAR